MLTGRVRYRANWRGKLIIQVEEASENHSIGPDVNMSGKWIYQWRDARVEDYVQPTGERHDKYDDHSRWSMPPRSRADQ